MKTKKLLLMAVMACLAMTSFASVAIFPLSMISSDCDSMITNYDGYGNSGPYVKEVYKHDAQGRLTSLIRYEQSGTNGWTENGKEEYTYDSSGAMDRKIYWWDDSTQDWRLSAEWEYDAHGNLTAYSEYGDGIHRDYGDEYKYEYDSEGKATLNTHFMWDYNTQDWSNIPIEKTEYEYDAQGNLIKESTYNWHSSTNSWDPYIPVTTYEYDDQGREITRIYYNSCTTWTDHFELSGGTKYVTEYDANNRKASETKYTVTGPNDLTGTFVDEHKYEYDDQGNQISDNDCIYQQFILGSFPIFSPPLYIYLYPRPLLAKSDILSTYDSAGHLTKQIQNNYQYGVFDFTIPSDLSDYTIDHSNPSNYFINYEPDSYNIKQTSATEYWNAQWYYPNTDNQTGITPVNGLSKTSVSPSPAVDFITVSGLQSNETLYVYDINGQLLITRKATSATETVPVGNLPSGIYLLKTSNGQTVKWVKH
ncbi:MAG: T9SS type A sorting domain-containing protein [Candidatus Azobacteroides sp.]|nr:T9SS type A sorting domain-containing protein [Candidatus Azobacteroides sp.]